MADLTVSSDVDSFMAAANAAVMRNVLSLGTIATQASSAVAITGGTLAGLTGLTIRSTGAAFDLAFASSEALTAGRTLSFNVGDANRTLTIPATGTAALLGTANVFTAAQTITQGSANAGILASTGYSLTGSNATNMIDLAGTWNTSGAPTAIKLNITRTAAAATSMLIDLQQGAATAFGVQVNSAGNAKMLIGARGANLDTTSDYSLSLNGYFGVAIQQNSAGVNCIGGNYFSIGTTTDMIVGRKAAATLQLGVDAAGVTNQMFTAASRITSDGVGANLTIAGGNGRGGAGGSLIFSYYTTAAAATIGTLTEAMRINTLGQIILTNLPTSDPGVVGVLYRTAGAVMISV